MKILSPILLCAALLVTSWVYAEPNAILPTDSPAMNGQLKGLQQAIISTQKDLYAKQVAQQEAEKTLRQTKIALDKAKRELDVLNQRQQAEWTKLQALQDTLNQLQSDIESTQAQVVRLLTSYYKNHQPNAVVLFLKNADANQKSRFLTYVRHINQANDRVIQNLVQQEQELAAQEQIVNAELTRINRLALEQQKKLQRLGQNRSQVQATHQKLNQEIKARQQSLAQMRENEQRLNQLIATIATRQAARRKAEAVARTHAAQKRAQIAKKRGTSKALPTSTTEDLTLQPEKNTGISHFQGRLPMPVSGSVVGTFGSPRASGGVWRGLFIETDAASVHSIAEGQVVHAGAITGFGQTVMIDHGAGYISVYTGLSNSHVRNGSTVAAGTVIGTSGTLPTGEHGLYFELRYHGRTMNPRSWLR